MTCKDCIETLKRIIGKLSWELYAKDLEALYMAIDVLKKLEQQKYIELPCKAGTELFLSDYNTYHHRLKEYKIIGNRVVMVIKCFELQQTFYRYVDEHFGKTVFLTKEEAEAKLKELNVER